ncbi:hypothetical protein [Desulfovibrio sp. UCD-KL4C]|uniref:hypothetical protein n=1 Tax=Desulfovibrio sp. UCD-KL4C TaxID=2578120 RepID=UPI0025BF61A5|nr:hypothetical protein [Desulfovibrio sp. UCD-KL4C]
MSFNSKSSLISAVVVFFLVLTVADSFAEDLYVVDRGIIYLTTYGQPNKITTYSASGTSPSPITETEIIGASTNIEEYPYSLFVKNGEI